MKKRIYILFICLSTPLMSMEVREKEPEVKALLLDLGGVFFFKSEKSYMRQLGIEGVKNAVGYLLLDWRAPWKLRQLIFDVLDEADVEKDEEFKVAHDDHRPIPYLLSAYQAGRFSLKEAKDTTLRSFEQLKEDGRYCSEREAYLVQRGIELMFSPRIYAEEIITKDVAALTILKALRDAQNVLGEPRFRLVAISNWDKDSFEYMRERFAEELGWFDELVISGTSDSHSVKPNKELYDESVEKAGVSREECLFVDDQHVNTVASQAFGIQSLLYSNATEFRKELEERGLLAAPPQQDLSPMIATTLFVTSGAWLLFNVLKR